MSYNSRADIYDVEYRESRDVPFVTSLLAGDVNRVIELPCGAGRLSRHIAPCVAELDVVDIEPKMVSLAVDAARVVAPDCTVTGHVEDMLHLSLDARADLAIVPREGLQLVPPVQGREVLRAVAEHIVPGGRIFVDIALFGGASLGDPDYFKFGQLDGVFSPDWTRKMRNGDHLQRSSAQTDEGDAILFDLNYAQGSEPCRKWSSQMRIYRYDSGWIKASVPEDMALENIYGGYDRTPLLPDADRMLAIFRKRSN